MKEFEAAKESLQSAISEARTSLAVLSKEDITDAIDTINIHIRGLEEAKKQLNILLPADDYEYWRGMINPKDGHLFQQDMLDSKPANAYIMNLNKLMEDVGTLSNRIDDNIGMFKGLIVELKARAKSF